MDRKFLIVAAALVMTAGTAAAQDGSIFSVGQQVEVKVGGGWRPCTVKDAGGASRVARADCPAFPTPGYTYPPTEENFVASGSMDVRMPGACETTSTNAITRPIRGCVAATPAANRGAVAVAATPGRPAPSKGPRAVAPPAAGAKLERCAVGQRVLTPGGLPATVVSVQGAACTIRTDGGHAQIDGTFAAFMLRSIGAPPPGTTAATGTGRLPVGEYGCIGAGTTQLAGMGSKLLPGGRYTDLEGGSPGTYRIVGNTIRFTGGHLDGQVGMDIKDNGYRIGMVSCQRW